MTASVSAPRTSARTRLFIALGAVVLATLLVAIVAIVRTGWSHWIMSLVRVAVLSLLSILVLRGVRWARWVLIAWLSLAAITFVAFSIAVADSLVGIALFITMIGLYIWAVVELTLADVSDPR